MSTVEPVAGSRSSGVDTISGLMSAAALFFSLVALAYHPITVSFAAILLALVGAGMSSRHRLLAASAVAVSSICFVVGIAIAVITSNSLW